MKALEDTLDGAVFDELRLMTAGAGPRFLTELIDGLAHDAESGLAQLRQAVAAGDHAAVGRIAPSIRGLGSQLGGRRLASTCER